MLSPPLIGATVFSKLASGGPTGQVTGTKPSPNNLPFSEHDVQTLQNVLWAKAEGIERQTHVDLLERTSKAPISSEEDAEEMTLPDPEAPLVYSLHNVGLGRQQWEAELPLDAIGRIKKQEKGKSNLHTQEYSAEKLESMSLDPRLSKLIQKYQHVFRALLSPLSCKTLVHIDPKLKPECEAPVVRRHPYTAPQDQINEIRRLIQECIDAGGIQTRGPIQPFNFGIAT